MKAMNNFDRAQQQQVSLSDHLKDRHHKVPHKAMSLLLKSSTRRETLKRVKKIKTKANPINFFFCFNAKKTTESIER